MSRGEKGGGMQGNIKEEQTGTALKENGALKEWKGIIQMNRRIRRWWKRKGMSGNWRLEKEKKGE